MEITRIDKVVFRLSAVVLVFLYGYGSASFDWFPHDHLDRALKQAAYHLGPPPHHGPRVYERSRAGAHSYGSVNPGLTLVTTHSERWKWQPGLMLLDQTGEIVHEWVVASEEIFGDHQAVGLSKGRKRGVHGARLSEDGHVTFNLEYAGVVRMDACGEVIWHVDNMAHHAIGQEDDGSFWVPRSTLAEMPKSAAYPNGYRGLDEEVNHDHLVRINPTGDVVERISMLDVLYNNGLERFVARRHVAIPTDILHVNDVEVLSSAMADDYPLFDAGDLLVSVRASNLVLVIDPDTERVKWHKNGPWFQQHDPDFIGDGWLGVFDNARDGTLRGSMLGGSRIVAVRPGTGSVRVLFPGPESDPFYTKILGKWQLLDNGNLLLTEGQAGRIVEVDPMGRTVWEWIHAGFDEENTVEITEGSKYDITREDVADWPCSDISRAADTSTSQREENRPDASWTMPSVNSQERMTLRRRTDSRPS